LSSLPLLRFMSLVRVAPPWRLTARIFKFKLIVQMVNVKVKIIAEETIAMVASERICKAI